MLVVVESVIFLVVVVGIVVICWFSKLFCGRALFSLSVSVLRCAWPALFMLLIPWFGAIDARALRASCRRLWRQC